MSNVLRRQLAVVDKRNLRHVTLWDRRKRRHSKVIDVAEHIDDPCAVASGMVASSALRVVSLRHKAARDKVFRSLREMRTTMTLCLHTESLPRCFDYVRCGNNHKGDIRELYDIKWDIQRDRKM